jgi:HEAT repeat protein
VPDGSIFYAATMPEQSAEAVFATIAAHDFHPLNEDGTFTEDRRLDTHGIADLDDLDWRIRTVAVRDLVRRAKQDRTAVEAGLAHDNLHVRHLVATALGIVGESAAVPALAAAAESDPSPMVRSQAVIALGQITATSATQAFTLNVLSGTAA